METLRHENSEEEKLAIENLYETAGEHVAEFLPQLKELSKELNEKGFPVDENCRIKIESFIGKEGFSEEMIQKDSQAALSLEKKFLEQDGDKEVQEKNIGELMEIMKTLAFNKHWFQSRLIALRTTKFDDYFSGIDEIVFDTETHQPLAAIDTTTNPQEKAKLVKEQIKKGGRVRYGFDTKDGKEKSLKDLPTFIISLTAKDLSRIIEGLKGNEEFDKNFHYEQQIIWSLGQQSIAFQAFVDKENPAVKESYHRAGKIFKGLIR
ncbi:MAG: hypothetical protein WC297_01015 [Candidatus Paceibacterota bacterium]|jgi:hypothetical protein